MSLGVEMSGTVESYFSFAPLAAVLISLLAAVLIVLSSRRPNLRETWTIVAALCKFAVVSSMVPAALAGLYPEINLFEAKLRDPLAKRLLISTIS